MADIESTDKIASIPTAGIILDKIRSIATGIGDFEAELILDMLNDWNNQWVELIAEAKTNVTDNRDNAREANDERLKKRVAELSNIGKSFISPFRREETV